MSNMMANGNYKSLCNIIMSELSAVFDESAERYCPGSSYEFVAGLSGYLSFIAQKWFLPCKEINSTNFEKKGNNSIVFTILIDKT